MRRQLKASLCNGRRSSGHWVCISLVLPTVSFPPSPSLPLPYRAAPERETERGKTVWNQSQKVQRVRGGFLLRPSVFFRSTRRHRHTTSTCPNRHAVDVVVQRVMESSCMWGIRAETRSRGDTRRSCNRGGDLNLLETIMRYFGKSTGPARYLCEPDQDRNTVSREYNPWSKLMQR